MEKICAKCNLSKQISEFHVLKTSKDGFYKWCKSCKKEYDKIYRKSEKIQSLYKSKEYKQKKALYNKQKFTEDKRISMYRRTKSRALKNNIPFNIELEDIIIPEYCPILGIKLLNREIGISKRGGFEMNSISIDKIIPELGYIKGNIQIISMKANAMKYSATKDELIKFCTNILKQIKNKKYDRIVDN